MNQPKDDPIAPFSRAVLELFQQELRKVRFPDLDHESLLAAAEELRAAQLEVECVEAALASARDVVRERARVLSAQATRGLSYARVFAGDNLALGARIAQIELLAGADGAAATANGGKKRGRPRKDNGGGELFASESAGEGTDAEVAA